MSNRALVGQLRAVSSAVYDEPELLAELSRDWWPVAAKIPIPERLLPAVVALPVTTSEVADIVRIAGRTGRPIIPRGGGSNLVGAIEPQPGAIVLDTRGLNVIEAVDETNCTVRVGSGVVGDELEDRLTELGFSLCFDPRSLRLSTVGGWIATNASGATSAKYGGIESLLSGTELVLPDGRIIDEQVIRPLIPGSGMTAHCLGSEGIFGVVTTATLRVRPIPERRMCLAFDIPDERAAIDALRSLIQRGVVPAMVEYRDADAAAELLGDPDRSRTLGAMLVVLDGIEALVLAESDLVSAALGSAKALLRDDELAVSWFERRHDTDALVDENSGEGHISDSVELLFPWSRLLDGRDRCLAAAAEIAGRVWSTITLSDWAGGRVTITFAIERPDDAQALSAYDAIWERVVGTGTEAGGWLVLSGGVGQLKLRWPTPALLATQQRLTAVKRDLDPAGLMHPGRWGMKAGGSGPDSEE